MAAPMCRLSRQALKNAFILQNCGKIAGNDAVEAARSEQRAICTRVVTESGLYATQGQVQAAKDLTLATSLLNVNKRTGYVRLYVTMRTNHTCWKCHRSIDYTKEQFFCECGVIQPENSQRTFFEVLGVETSFDVDLRELSQKFRQLQSSLHPDKFAQKSEEEKSFSEAQSSLVNKAFSTLQKPLSRGLYLLELYGEPLDENEIEMEPDFLMEIMEINEKLAGATSVKIISSIGDENRIVLNDLVEQLSKAFKQKNVNVAKEILARLKYFTNIDDKVKNMLNQFASNP